MGCVEKDSVVVTINATVTAVNRARLGALGAGVLGALGAFELSAVGDVFGTAVFGFR